MIALSVRQPWAWAILHGKHIENRTWRPDFRGRFLLHAGKSTGTLGDFSDDCEALGEIFAKPVWEAFRDTFLQVRHFRGRDLLTPREGALDLGCIVGAATLVGVVEPGTLPPRVEDRRWHAADQYGLMLEDVRPVPIVPCVGALGFFRVPADVDARLRALAKAGAST